MPPGAEPKSSRLHANQFDRTVIQKVVEDADSIAAGLDYPGVGPEHAYLRDTGRARYVAVEDDNALRAFEVLSRTEGIIPAFEPAHALAFVLRAVDQGELPEGSRVLVNLSGRGDKDLDVYRKVGNSREIEEAKT